MTLKIQDLILEVNADNEFVVGHGDAVALQNLTLGNNPTLGDGVSDLELPENFTLVAGDEITLNVTSLSQILAGATDKVIDIVPGGAIRIGNGQPYVVPAGMRYKLRVYAV